ncbi:MAG: prolyl oligopeptidase family serine peptidase [Vitreoscilla sp.]|nr:prolyl oligopeptidase family serine peptidase [Vitreoscilla sp.]
MVVVPQRRGRGGSGGRYLEGWSAEARRYSCDPATALTSLDRAMEDLSEVVRHLLARPEVDSRRLLVGGHSKGGLLALTFAARQPALFIGAINFVGGWVGERCETAGDVNGSAFTRAARFSGPSLWLYGERDPYYDIAHSRRNFDKFRAAGGQGEFHVLRMASQRHDHQIVHGRAEWQDHMSMFLAPLR